MKMFLFPLPHIVLYPGTVKPLNIFEARYISMIHDAISKKIPIALGFVDDPGKMLSTMPGQYPDFVRPVAGYGHPLILEERSDNSLLVIIQGHGKAKLGKIQKSDTPYMIIHGDVLEENSEVALPMQMDVNKLKAILFSWVMQHVSEPSQQRHFIDSVKTAQEVVGCLASFLVKDSDLQQILLEEDNMDYKVELLRSMVISTDYSAA